ncbi:MAG: Phosphate transport system permease protein PstA [Frankiales bacterium]|jgi:phosphate transport system permease protein|nr:Phosphate transport system permease protein PstA [Frankiales bacterium]
MTVVNQSTDLAVIQSENANQGSDVPRSLSTRSFDDRASWLAAMLGALGIVWVAFQVTGWSGKLGFTLLWFAVYLALYAAVTAAGNPRPVVVDRLAAAAVAGGAAVVGLALLSTVAYTVQKGWPAFSQWSSFYTETAAGVRPTAPLDQGGILHAIAGTAIQVGIALVISLPLGLGTAVYITEVGGRTAKTVRTVVEAMTALPDVLAGLFTYATLILVVHLDRTGFVAAVALAVTMTPIVARSAEVALRVVPGGLREASLALGASQASTVWRVVLPTARAGLATSLILGIARVSGETAPLLIVSGASTYQNLNPFAQPMNSLPLYIFSAVRSGQPNFIARGFGAATVLLALVTVLFALARYLARPRRGNR